MRLTAIGVLMLLAVLPGTGAAAPAGAEVVVNAQSDIDQISRPLLRGIFGMRVRAWPDGTPVRVFVLDDSDPVHVEFCKSVLRMYPYQLRQNWDRLVYSGTGQPPIGVASEKELLKQVAATPGAIGYLNRAAFTARGDQLKVLNVRE
jgi:ABC-type phosphate transport system substrate-binding protein